MTQVPLISVLILTRNEEAHIQRCIDSALKISSLVYVVDSCSVDRTVEIATKSGAIVISEAFDGFSEKFNWCLLNIDFKTPWIFRLDADEVLSNTFLESINSSINFLSSNISGIYVRRQLWFMGRWMKYGGMYPTYSMRLWRRGCAILESRDLDEHLILLKGESITLNIDVIDNPLTNLTSWIAKHNSYALLEARSITSAKDNVNSPSLDAKFFGTKLERIRWIKINFFYKLPLFIRPFLYFFYRYFLRLGIFDGREGFVFHFMHALWYRILVDATLLEKRKKL
jgi:glycosyltransferase involved in cell wall biosynthesis